MKAMSTYIVYMANKVAIFKTGQGLLTKASPELLASGKKKGAKDTCMGDSFIETIPRIYFGFSLRVEKAIVPY